MRHSFFQAACLLVILPLLDGCTSTALRMSTISDARSVNEFEHEMVLDNVAIMLDEPGSIPWCDSIVKGTATISDTANTGFSDKWPNAVQTYSLSGSRAWQGDWTLSPILDTNILTQLSYKYADVAEAASANTNYWLHVVQKSMIPPVLFLHGSHGLAHVWVEPKDYGHLEDLTMEVLDLASPPFHFSSNNIDAGQMVSVLTNPKSVPFWDDLSKNTNYGVPNALNKYLRSRNSTDFKQAMATNLNAMLSNLTTGANKVNVFICSEGAISNLIANTQNPATKSLLAYNLSELEALSKKDRATLHLLQPTVAKLNTEILLYGFEANSPFLISGGPGGSAGGGSLEAPAYGAQLLR